MELTVGSGGGGGGRFVVFKIFTAGRLPRHETGDNTTEVGLETESRVSVFGDNKETSFFEAVSCTVFIEGLEGLIEDAENGMGFEPNILR